MLGIIIAIVILIIIYGVFIYARRRGPGGIVQLSHLKCTKCSSEFDYAYIPGMSFTSIRLGNSRLIECPVCHKSSLFNIRDTRVDPKTHHCERRIGPS